MNGEERVKRKGRGRAERMAQFNGSVPAPRDKGNAGAQSGLDRASHIDTHHIDIYAISFTLTSSLFMPHPIQFALPEILPELGRDVL